MGMSVLVAGMRVLGTSPNNLGALTTKKDQLNNDFFTNLLDMGTKWNPSGDIFEGKDASGATKWRASAVDLVFGSNPELRAIAEYYAEDDSQSEFVTDFVTAW